MGYSKLSDNKINAEVALHWLGKGNFGLMNGVVETFGGSFDPCNNPADAWPIILKNCISLVWDCAEDGSSDWWNAFDQFDDCRVQYQSNPLRAAMILFLMMQEGE